MSLSLAKDGEIPKDAVVIDEERALTYQWRIIKGWDNMWDVWSLRYGPGILGALSAVTGIYVNGHYRHKLKLGTYGRGSTYLPIVVIPSIFSMLAHKLFVQRYIILDDFTGCPICLQVRAGAIQSGLGVVYPTILAPIASLMFATRHYTYRLPSVTTEPLEILKLWRNMTRPIFSVLGLAIAGQSAIGIYITYKEQLQSLRLQVKMKVLERIAEEKYEEEKMLQAVKNF